MLLCEVTSTLRSRATAEDGSLRSTRRAIGRCGKVRCKLMRCMKSRAGLKDFLRPNARMRNQQIEGPTPSTRPPSPADQPLPRPRNTSSTHTYLNSHSFLEALFLYPPKSPRCH